MDNVTLIEHVRYAPALLLGTVICHLTIGYGAKRGELARPAPADFGGTSIPGRAAVRRAGKDPREELLRMLGQPTERGKSAGEATFARPFGCIRPLAIAPERNSA